jgi:hypothetical protein
LDAIVSAVIVHDLWEQVLVSTSQTQLSSKSSPNGWGLRIASDAGR